MEHMSTDPTLALEFDAQDELARFREEFIIEDPGLIYLDGNSLGRLPKRTLPHLSQVLESEWGERLIRGWNEGWINLPTSLGAKIASLIGAREDEVVVTGATSVNLFKLALAALQSRPGRTEIVSDVLNFPSDLYVLQGIVQLLGSKHRLRLIPSRDGISIAAEDVESILGDDVALVSMTHVAFKSSFMYDMPRITELAHDVGALTLWDLSHSVGAVPLDMRGWNVDMAVGCSYKYLNGGPGAPAFIYVREDLQEALCNPIWGWLGAENPFAFDLNFTPASDISRFKVGTPPILSMKAVEPAVEVVLQAGIDRLRAKSVRQTEYLIYLAEQWLMPLGFELGSPKQSSKRGSHVALRHPEAYRITQALIHSPPPSVRVIPDFRAPDNIRLGVAPLYTSFTEIHQAILRIREIVRDGVFHQYTDEQSPVT